MDPVGTSFAVVGGLVWCYKFGSELLKKWRVLQEADYRIREHTVQLNDHCIRLDEQTKVLEMAWNCLDGRHRLHFHDLTQMLKQSLQAASDSLTGAESKKPRRFPVLRKKGSSEAMRYTFIYESIEDAVKKLERWHARFDSVFFLFVRVRGLSLEPQLGEEQPAPGQPARRLRRMRIAAQGSAKGPLNMWLSPTIEYSYQGTLPYSSVTLASYKSKKVLVDTLTPDSQAELDRTNKSIYDLGEILKQSDPGTFGLLECFGIYYQSPSSATGHQPRFDMLFTCPDVSQNPASLRSLLRRKDSDFSMNERLDLARELAKSLMFVHSSKFVHKNIRPETIVVFPNQESKIGKCFLMGFDQFRPVDGWTQRKGDVRLEKQIYRHPSRQGLHPEADYVMQHDIYSLGVVLLEIGMWTSFVEYDKTDKPSLLPFIGTKAILADKQDAKRAVALKARLTEAASYLPARMGRIYTDVVKACLNCLDDDEGNIFGIEGEFVDPDGITVAVRFSETVLGQLHAIAI